MTAPIFGQVPVDAAHVALADLAAGRIDLEAFDQRIRTAAKAYDLDELEAEAWRRRS